MVSTLREPPAGAEQTLRRAWPELPWERMRPAHGAFHWVLVIPGAAVVRLRSGAGHRETIDREMLTSALLADAGLGVPAPLGAAVSAEGWSAAIWSHVPGQGMVARSWAEDRRLILGILDRWRDAALTHPQLERELPPVRTWCGGEEWPRIVDEITARAPALQRRARAAAEDVAADAAGPGADAATLVHGDFGPHNILLHGRTETDDGEPRVIDTDHAAWADPAVDLSTLLAFYPRSDLARDVADTVLDRAVRLRRSLPLQIAAAAHLRGDVALREHALGRAGRRLTDVPRP